MNASVDAPAHAAMSVGMSAASSAAVALSERAARQARVVAALTPLVPAHALLWRAEDTTPYECDGLTAYRQMPLLVALPEDEAQVAAVLKASHALQVPVVARGAGTGLSGGAMPHARDRCRHHAPPPAPARHGRP